ncbi:MAG: glyoxalase/bleomycin resistance/extradiol dioxygenase family protein [Gammaproteobacteria bacterium]|nr:glyoxalase/bleomycin resistance/extradiol dioxygenase family protein [Gammaproteobacteria bacterium]
MTQRFQLALNVDDIEIAIQYYSKLFDAKVNKSKPGYANFAIENPPLKLVLFENPGANERINHLGVENFDQSDVDQAITRFKAEGIADEEEVAETCCFAVQNKIWSTDPSGTRWEWYRVIEDADSIGGSAVEANQESGVCCASS